MDTGNTLPQISDVYLQFHASVYFSEVMGQLGRSGKLTNPKTTLSGLGMGGSE